MTVTTTGTQNGGVDYWLVKYRTGDPVLVELPPGQRPTSIGNGLSTVTASSYLGDNPSDAQTGLSAAWATLDPRNTQPSGSIVSALETAASGIILPEGGGLISTGIDAVEGAADIDSSLPDGGSAGDAPNIGSGRSGAGEGDDTPRSGHVDPTTEDGGTDSSAKDNGSSDTARQVSSAAASVGGLGDWKQFLIRCLEGLAAGVLIVLGLMSMSGSDPTTLVTKAARAAVA